jgi:microcin C transport system substrate-binding protein
MARNLSLVLAPIGLLLLSTAGSATASEPASTKLEHHHALSLVGEPAYGPHFTHFDWVNPNAPKGGRVRMMEFGTFDSLNPFSIKGNPAYKLGLIYDTLFVNSPDEPATEYGLVAEWVAFPADFSSATFQLRAGARFHDGTPIAPEDVIFSMEALKKAHPRFAAYYQHVAKAEKVADNQVKFTFDVAGNREMPQIVGQLPVLPKHFWQAKGSNGEPRDLAKSTLEIPLGSGPYRIKEADAGRSVTFERVKDWWAKDLPVSKGQWNFDEIRSVYFRDWLPGFEAFKAGELDYWEEGSAKNWATLFDFDAVKRGRVVKAKIPVAGVAPMKAFAFNIRRPQLQDARVRHAFNLAFNFEAANKNLFYGEYQRIGSYFDNSELKATGLPQGRELAILNEVKDKVPPEVFTTEWRNPVNAGADADGRRHLSMAAKLLADAGYRLKGGILTNAAGVQLKVEFLTSDPEDERIILPYTRELERLGIKASLRVVDSAQFASRVKKFDFDVITRTFQQYLSPGAEQRDFWGSDAADREGSRNVIGIKNPALDALIEHIVLARDRPELVAATRALDRVLLWNHYVVPQWDTPYDRLAMWNVYARPARLPRLDSSFLRVWWWDDAKAKQSATGG